MVCLLNDCRYETWTTSCTDWYSLTVLGVAFYVFICLYIYLLNNCRYEAWTARCMKKYFTQLMCLPAHSFIRLFPFVCSSHPFIYSVIGSQVSCWPRSKIWGCSGDDREGTFLFRPGHCPEILKFVLKLELGPEICTYILKFSRIFTIF